MAPQGLRPLGFDPPMGKGREIEGKSTDIDSIKDRILSQVDPKAVWEDYFPGWKPGKNVCCPFHDDEKPSMSLADDGQAYCHGCGWKCSSVVGFVVDHDKIPFNRALKRIRYRYVGDVVPAREWDTWHKDLLKNKDLLDELFKVRGITKEGVKRFKLGWHRKRLTIPIFDEMGCCVNVRMHDALHRLPDTAVKMVSYKDETGKSFGSARVFPIEAFAAKHTKIYHFEGELNAILACCMGLNAATITSGARVWKEEFAEYYRGRKVVVCQDVNDPDGAGQEGAERKCKALAGVAMWVKNVKLPIPDRGGDIIDYVVKHGHKLADFMALETSTPYFAHKAEDDKKAADRTDYDKAEAVSLKEASYTENFGKPIKMQCLVASQDIAPYVPPRKVVARCLEFAQHQAAGKIPPKCGACWMPEAGLEKEVELKPENREMVAILDKNDQRLDQGLRKMTDVPAECKVEFEVKDVYNVHTVGIIPDVHNREDAGRHDYVLRTGYYFGKNMESNKSYEFTGFSMSHPDTQLVTHVFVKAKGTLSAVERYKMAPETAEQLDALFKDGGDPYDKLMGVYDDFARTVTKIVQRPLLHAAVDLVWHSPLQFSFNGERISKGWLEAIVFGDTRCGKGYVAEGLARHYGLGEIVSGENCSVAGLVGGLESMGKRLVLRWGAVPLNDRGLVIIDEMGDMAAEIFGRMSRVRSEGIAEVTKIGHHQKTFARTRLVWLGNPREGVMADYTYGVQALQGMVGKAEDIARFDYAFAVADGEVPSSAINARRDGSGDARHSRYGSALCRQLVYWAWSRTADQVQFTDKAVSAVLTTHAKELAGKYSPAIPLVQGQNIRVKIAKVAAAVAARLFSHPKGSPEVLRVTAEHVECAARLLDEFYKTPAMAYDSFSRKAQAETTLSGESELNKLFRITLKPRNALSLVRCLLSRRISIRALAASASMDKMEAETTVLDVLLRCNAIQEKANGYFAIRGPFKMWLEKMEAELESKVEFGGGAA